MTWAEDVGHAHVPFPTSKRGVSHVYDSGEGKEQGSDCGRCDGDLFPRERMTGVYVSILVLFLAALFVLVMAMRS